MAFPARGSQIIDAADHGHGLVFFAQKNPLTAAIQSDSRPLSRSPPRLLLFPHHRATPGADVVENFFIDRVPRRLGSDEVAAVWLPQRHLNMATTMTKSYRIIEWAMTKSRRRSQTETCANSSAAKRELFKIVSGEKTGTFSTMRHAALWKPAPKSGRVPT